MISDSLLLTAGNRLSHAIYQQLFVFKTTENGACYQKNRGFIRRLDRIFEICQRKRTQKYIFCVLDWRPRGESNPRPHAQEYGVPFRKLFISYLPVLFLRKLCCLEAGQFAQIPLKYAALQRLFKCRISKVLAGTPCDRGLPGAISKCYQHRWRIIL